MRRPGPSVWRPTPADPAALFDRAELDRARRYRAPLRRVELGRVLARVAVLAVLVATELGARVVDALGVQGWVAQLVVVLVALEAVLLVVEVPFDVWIELRHDRRWGLSTQTGAGLARDTVVGALVSLAFGVALLVPVYALVRTTTWWWVWAWGLVVLYAAVGGLLFPVLLAPLFNRFEPLTDAALSARVRAVIDRAGVEVGRVEVADESRRSRRDNAYVAGLGPTRRLVLYDSLLETPPELVEQVVAHELGHVRRHHVALQLPALAAASFAVLAVLGALSRWDGLLDAVGLAGPADPAGLPAVVLLGGALGALAAMPVAWLSRAFERQADREGLDLLGRPDRVEVMLRRLHLVNLADLAPSPMERLRATHPPVAERIAFARSWRHAQSAREPRGE